MKISNHTVEDFKNLPPRSLIYYYNGEEKVYGLFVEILPNDFLYAYWGYYKNGGYTNPEEWVNLGWVASKHVFIDKQKELEIIEDPQFKDLYI